MVDCLTRVSRGEADAYIETTPVVEYRIAAHNMGNLAVVGTIDNAQTPSRFALRQGATMLLSLLNRAIATTTIEERAALAERWMSRSAADLLFGRAIGRIALSAREQEHLAKLRRDGLVATRREAQTIHYSLASPEARKVIGLLYRLYCN